jgi:hypothetical protein
MTEEQYQITLRKYKESNPPPKRESFQTEEEYENAFSLWHINYWMYMPNKPGYDIANND